MHLRTRSIVAATAATLAFAVLPASAATDFLLKIDGVEGESALKGFEKQIEIESFSWGVSQSSSGSGGARAGKSCPSDVSLSKLVDKATPPLIGRAAGGTVSPTAILIGLRPGGQTAPQVYLKIEMKDVLVSSYQSSGSSGGGAMDALSLRFGSATVTYFTQRDDGSSGPAPTTVATVQGC
jgi:type VI secretion system secreted protein Hcp